MEPNMMSAGDCHLCIRQASTECGIKF